MSDNILEPTINGLPPVTDWEKVFLALQQANEAFLRGATLPELGKQIVGDVQIQGADFVDLPVAEDATPVPLPIPTTGNKFGFLADGKFTQPTGGTLEYSATQWGLTLFDGDKWVKKFTLDLPEPKGVDIIDPEGSAIPTEKAVADYSLEKISPRALPDKYKYQINDRPDIGNQEIIIVDKNGFYIPLPYILTSSSRVLPDQYRYLVNDRPDLSDPITVIDKNGLFVPSSAVNANDLSDFIKGLTYTYFGEVAGYPVESVKDLNSYYQQWNDIMNIDPQYITKTALTNSGGLNLPIWRFDFQPKQPKIKIMLVGCTHGWEKNISFGLRVFMKQLTESWRGNEALTFMRQNVHFIVVPVVSPDPFVQNPFTGSNTVRDRAGFETPPFPASWTKSGNVVTVTFNAADFPANQRTSATDYFTNRPASDLIGKVGVTLLESSNSTELPQDVYEIKSIIDARTITIETASSGISSGTVKMCVKSDVNRNSATASWPSLGHATTKVGNPQTFYDNKGTRPFSLQETSNIRDIFLENKNEVLKIVAYLDFHSGAGDYVTYISYPSGNRDISFDVVKDIYKSLFNIDPTYHIGGTMASLFQYATEQLNIVGSNPEWHSSEPPGSGGMDAQQATELHQWIGNLLYITSKINFQLKK